MLMNVTQQTPELSAQMSIKLDLESKTLVCLFYTSTFYSGEKNHRLKCKKRMHDIQRKGGHHNSSGVTGSGDTSLGDTGSGELKVFISALRCK